MADRRKHFPKAFPAAGGKVHGGFLNAYRRVEREMNAELSRHKGKSVWFTGHSLGGALALLGACSYKSHADCQLVTFGQPRALTSKAKKHVKDLLGDQYVRFVNQDDIVPVIPLSMKHTGELFHFDKKGSVNTTQFGFASFLQIFFRARQFYKILKSLRKSSEKGLNERLKVALQDAGLASYIEDHSTDLYIEKVKNLAEK